MTSEDVFPLLVADLVDRESCEMLEDFARRREVVLVPLVVAPVDRRRHVLEAFYPGAERGIRLLAEPVGGPTPQGFPLRLEPLEGAPASPAKGGGTPAGERPAGRAFVKSRVETTPTMTARQSRDLEPGIDAVQAEVGEPDFRGRLLANGKYHLDELVGAGGMGAVYRAHHRDLDKLVAVKVLHVNLHADAAFASRFQAEALTMSRIDHPNIARVIDFGQETDGLLYLVMDFLDGHDLELELQKSGALHVERIARIMSQVCAALGQVHRHGIIHRDIKPSNILLAAGHDDEEGVPTEIATVCDFGVALARGASGRVAGTPEYMSPEQCRGAELDARSDIYSCGVVLYELATGQLPFVGSTADVMRSHLTEEPLPPSQLVPDVDPLLEQIILKALAKDPAARHATMRELRHELRELLAPVVLAAPEAAYDPSQATSSRAPAPTASAPAGPETEPIEGLQHFVVDRFSSPSPPSAPGAGPRSRVGAGGPGGANAWLEGDEAGTTNIVASLIEDIGTMNVYHEGDALADRLRQNAIPWLSELAGTIDEGRFGARAEILQHAVVQLMKTADVDALSDVIAAMRRILKEEGTPAAASARTTWSGRILRTLRDPARLAPIVDAALGGPRDPTPEMVRVLHDTQAAGAVALLRARTERYADPVARGRFVQLVRAIGPGALPALRGALESALQRGERSGDLVDELLLAIPPTLDETTGQLVSQFLGGGTARTTAAALITLAKVWGDRARPLLHGALGNADEGVRAAAVRGLRSMGAIDGLVVRQIEPVLLGASAASEGLRYEIVVALAEAQPPAKGEASALLSRALRKHVASGASSPKSAGLVVAIAKALLVLGAPYARALVLECAEANSEPLRSQLLSLASAAEAR